MKIKNTGRYALAFTINKNGKDVVVEFDRRRLYLDTGNVATSGITEVSDEDFELLKKNKQFVKALETETFSEVTAEELASTTADSEALAAKDAEIAALKAELDKKAPTKKELKEKDEALAAKDEEINTLKAQLEALSKNKDEAAASETDGF
jgi:hypothetical protein